MHRGRLILIDLPRVVDLVGNPRAEEFLRRDVRNVTAWFAAHGLPQRLADPEVLFARLVTEPFRAGPRREASDRRNVCPVPVRGTGRQAGKERTWQGER